MTPHPVRQSFNRAATSYEASARLQQQVADQLIQEIHTSHPDGLRGLILDAGCGTGYCLNQLHRMSPDTSDAVLLGVDFAESMLRHNSCTSRALTINGDLQQLPLANATVDLYLSSLAWQWCDTGKALREAIRVLKPGGGLWLTTLVDGTFHEMNKSFCHAGMSPAAHMLHMLPAAGVCKHFEQRPELEVLAVRQQSITTWHPDFTALRRSIRGVGANRLPTSLPTTAREAIDRATRARLIEAYESLRTPRGLPLTYHVLTIHAQRI